MPILNDIQSKSPLFYQQYHVDLLLEDWSSALKNIAKLAENEKMFNECLAHIQKYKLFSSALLLFSDKQQFIVFIFIFFCIKKTFFFFKQFVYYALNIHLIKSHLMKLRIFLLTDAITIKH